MEQFYREQSGRILAVLIRVLGDFDLAEEAMQEAFAAALQQWPLEGPPANRHAWLIATARHKAVDHLRRRTRFAAKLDELEQAPLPPDHPLPGDEVDRTMADDSLRLIFTCCHPALAVEAQVALTLRTVCALSTEEIASAFLVSVPTLAQRLVRAKQKIRDAGIRYQVPPTEELPERLNAVMLVVYLVFNEGYAASSGDAWLRRPLCTEAIRLGRLLCELMPDAPEVRGLLALMLLQESRLDARVNAEGDAVSLGEQDRKRWDQERIREGLVLVESAVRSGGAGIYTLQAAIAALHAEAARPEDTDWPQIARLYEMLLDIHPSPVVELNHAVALAMAEGPQRGLTLLDALEARGHLDNYHLLPAARGDLLRRLGRWQEAADAYRQALSLVSNGAEQRFLFRCFVEAEQRSRPDPGPERPGGPSCEA